MKQVHTSYLIMVLCLVTMAISSGRVSAQDYVSTPITISKEKVKVNGQVCLSHIVLERQTLYAISKAYNVTIEEIYKYNPSVKEEGLKKNAILIIPLVEKTPQQERLIKIEEKAAAKAAKAEKKEVEAQEREAESQEREVEAEKQIVHVVRWYEDLKTIADNYNVTVESIIEANGLTGKKLKSRQKLIIPHMEEIRTELAEDNQEGTPREEPKSYDAEEDIFATQTADTAAAVFDINRLTIESKVDVALILPLKANGESGSRNYMDFYSGVLLATDMLQKQGIAISLKTFDIANEDEEISTLDLAECDVIIGPVSRTDLSQVLMHAPADRPVISPLDQKTADMTKIYSNFVQAPTSKNSQHEDLIRWLKEEADTLKDKVILISEKNMGYQKAPNNLEAIMDSIGVKYSKFSYSILESDNAITNIEPMLTKDGTVHFVIASESEAFVNDAIRNIYLLRHNKYDVEVYATSSIRNFETIGIENLHSCKLHISTGYDIDYKDVKTMDFVKSYRTLFKAEPSQYAFQGFDIANYFISNLYKYGDNWKLAVEQIKSEELQNSFKFKIDGNGLTNIGTKRILYKDNWEIEKL